MRIELRVDRNGHTIFRAECDTERGSSIAEFSKLALLARPPEQTCRDRGRRAGPSHRGNFCALARRVLGDWRYHSFYIASWSYGLACSKAGAAGLEVSKDTRPGAASSDGRSTAENSENGGVHGVGTVVFIVSA